MHSSAVWRSAQLALQRYCECGKSDSAHTDRYVDESKHTGWFNVKQAHGRTDENGAHTANALRIRAKLVLNLAPEYLLGCLGLRPRAACTIGIQQRA